MTNQDINIAIAEACGVVCARCNGTGSYFPYGKHEWFRYRLANPSAPEDQPPQPCDHFEYDPRVYQQPNIPDYLHDLNAMHEAWLTLKDYHKREYHVQLGLLVEKTTPNWDQLQLLDQRGLIANATAAQRAEAFLRTFGKWKD